MTNFMTNGLTPNNQETDMIERIFAVSKEVVRLLIQRKERLVLAESCTAGFICAQLGQIPGVSDCLCGSFVTYRPESKIEWLGVRSETIAQHTTESMEVAEEMARGAIMECAEAHWSLAVVGHFGPNAPKEKDGEMHVCITRYVDDEIQICQRISHVLQDTDRVRRQQHATEFVLSYLGRCLVQNV